MGAASSSLDRCVAATTAEEERRAAEEEEPLEGRTAAAGRPVTETVRSRVIGKERRGRGIGIGIEKKR